MQKKQVAGLMIAAAVFVAVGIISMLAHFAINRAASPTTLLSNGIELSMPGSDYIGVVPVRGTIYETPQSAYLDSSESYNHPATLDYIDAMMDSDHNKALLLVVDSPGGTVYASDELYLKLMEYKEYTGRPIYCYMESYACSGGYYISMAADKIYANRNGWTGSIGVIISATNLKGLYDKLGIEEINITSGANKSMGSPGEKLSPEARAIYQSLVDESYEQFVDIVAEGREMDAAQVRRIADGRIYSTQQAQKLGLVDEIMSYEDATWDILDTLGDEDLEFYMPDLNTFDWFSYLMSSVQRIAPKSDAQVLADFLASKGSEVPMYYASID